MQWFRFYSRTLNNRKVQDLRPALFKHWVNLMCLVCEYGQGGKLPLMKDVAFGLRLRLSAAQDVVDELLAENLLDCDANGAVFLHDWCELQRNSDDIASRVATHRRRNSAPNQAQNAENVTLHGTGAKRYCNALDTDTDTDTEREVVEKGESEGEKVSTSEPPTSAAGAAPPSDSSKPGKASSKPGRPPREGRAMPEECPRYTDLYHAEVVSHRAGTSKDAAFVEWQRWHAHHRAKGGVIKDFRASWRTWVMSKFWDGGATIAASPSEPDELTPEQINARTEERLRAHTRQRSTAVPEVRP